MSETEKCSSLLNEGPKDKRPFICGVVEGFYGKPWTFCQRKDLFKRLKEQNLNAFMYAPKDDVKHRARWRELYNEFEANELRTLIHDAELNGIDFYYSLAPGLDMTYSSETDLVILRKKFDQLRTLGCKSFAILFDDIEPRVIREKDKRVFQDNYAQAQVSVSNMLYEYLSKPNFLFCPTEYCESRAVPSVPESRYLNTIGVGLDPGIDFMWSGSRVVSRFITEESIQELTQVIRRPPVIWENLHANDYDKKRVYLGPYSGRSVKIIPKLRGVLTNPNCEYEANYIAIHTLAQWSRCTEDVNPLNCCNQETQLANAKSCLDEGGQLEKSEPLREATYDPDRALVRAIRDWLPYVLESRSHPYGEDSLTRSMRDDASAESQITKELGCEVQHDQAPGDCLANQQANDIEVDMKDAKASPLNSVGSSSDSSVKATSDMDISGSPIVLDTDSAAPTSASVQMVDSNSCDSCEMQDANSDNHHQQQQTTALMMNNFKQRDTQPIVDCIVCSANNSINNNIETIQKVDQDSLALLVDFFYLPFEHGLRGHALLSDIKWLIDNSSVFIADQRQRQPETQNDSKQSEEVTMAEDSNGNEPRDEIRVDGSKQAPMAGGQQTTVTDSGQPALMDSKLCEIWIDRAERLTNLCNCINRIISNLIHDCPNKLITAELYPYMAELRDVILMIMDYIKFLRHRRSIDEQFYYSSGPKRREMVAPCDEQEPWVHRGGLIGDMQRLII